MATVGAGSLYYRPRRTGERKRKSIRGCIVGSDLAVLNLVVIRKGENDVPGLTDADSARPNRLGPKRASHIRKLFVRARVAVVLFGDAVRLIFWSWYAWGPRH